MNQMVNYIRLTWKLASMLRTYRTYKSMVGFSKYEFNKKFLDSVTLFRVILCNLNPTHIYIYIK